MTNEMQKYKPLFQVKLKDGTIFYVDEEKRQVFEETLRKEMFITIGDETFQRSDIDRISKHQSGGYEFLPIRQRLFVEEKIKDFQTKFREYPSEKQIQVYVDLSLKT